MMDVFAQDEHFNTKQDKLLAMLERLLELPDSAVYFMFEQTVQQVQEVLSADLVTLFFHDSATDTLVALHSSDSAMGRRQRAIGMNRLPLANGGSAVETFLSGIPFLTGHTEELASELPGISAGLNIKSQMVTVFRTQIRHRGVVLVASGEPDFFSENDLDFLEAIARWIGHVVGRSELVEQMRRQDAELDQGWAVEQLLPIMTHELRNYLQPLRGRLDLLLERAKREGREKDIRDAESSLHTLTLLSRGVSNIIDITRLNQGVFVFTPVLVDLHTVVQDVVNTFEGSSIPFAIHFPQEVMVTADPQRLCQALETMVLSQIDVFAKPEEIIVDVAIESRADGPWVSLSTTGVGSGQSGIAADGLHAFVANSHSTHLGVQLYLAQQIALAHHGTFSIDMVADGTYKLVLAFPVETEELSGDGEDW